ncbi:sensor histidine kinase [Xylanibacillus composti]|uniref:sensor histidine kinase n=1 Tax=Xylanibacillus composti TaxID=1572762 RepID=UPI0028F6F807|nr:sensor histidine kinase [Xylanibacillus composti]
MRGKGRFSLLAWCLVCAVVIFIFVPNLLMEQSGRMDHHRAPLAAIGDMAISTGPDRPEADDWMSLDAASAGLNGYEGTVWLKGTLPELDWRSPHLFFTGMNEFEVFLDGALIFQFHPDNAHRHTNPMKLIHPAAISPQDAGKQLLIRTEWGRSIMTGNDVVIIGEPDQVMYTLIQSEFTVLIYSLLSWAAGTVGLLLFVLRKEKLYGWFSLFGLSMGLTLLWSCRSLQWFFEMESVYYWQLLLPPVAIWAGAGFYSHAMEVDRQPFVRLVLRMLVLYLAVVAAAALLVPGFYLGFALPSIAVMSCIGFGCGVVALAVFARMNGGAADTAGWADRRQERIWLLRGFSTFSICMTASLLLPYLPGLLEWLAQSGSYGYRVLSALMPNSLLLFMICMVMVLVSKVRRVHLIAERHASELLVKNRELEQFHHNLERLVERRTAELEQANRTLSATLREKAETLAEMSVLEERNRIAYEMHDVVGHTLTAAIVQLEATKKLAERHNAVSFEKLDLLIGLVRKGLDDIRKSVKLLKSDEAEPLSLADSLRELIRYTEDTMEIEIEADIDIPANVKLGRMTEHVLHHALQEGLTNGIRHGQCKRAQFRIYLIGNNLKFQLTNDGSPFGSAVPGFGLTSMTERVRLLGGEVHIRSSTGMDGKPLGCELTITLPLD